MYFANKESKIYIMHAVGVYIMPPLAVVQKTVFAKHYVSASPSFYTDFVGIMYLAFPRRFFYSIHVKTPSPQS